MRETEDKQNGTSVKTVSSVMFQVKIRNVLVTKYKHYLILLNLFPNMFLQVTATLELCLPLLKGRISGIYRLLSPCAVLTITGYVHF